MLYEINELNSTWVSFICSCGWKESWEGLLVVTDVSTSWAEVIHLVETSITTNSSFSGLLSPGRANFIFVILSSSWGNGKKLANVFQFAGDISNADSISWQNTFVFSFWFQRNMESFESNTKFGFPTSYDLKSTKWPWRARNRFLIGWFLFQPC